MPSPSLITISVAGDSTGVPPVGRLRLVKVITLGNIYDNIAVRHGTTDTATSEVATIVPVFV